MVTGEQHFEGAFPADGAGEGDHRRGAEEADLHAGRGEGGVLGGDGEIAGGDQLAAGRGGDTLDFGDDGLRDGLELLHQLGADIEDAAVFVDVAAGHLAEVVAGAEDLAGGGEDDGANLAIAADFVERGDEIEHQFEGEGVAALGAVQGDDGGGAFVGDLKIHEVTFALARNSFLRILPVAVRGSAPNSMCLGHLKCARRSRHQAINSSAVAEWLGLRPT